MVKGSRLHRVSEKLYQKINKSQTFKVMKIINSCQTIDQIDHTSEWLVGLLNGQYKDDVKLRCTLVLSISHRVELMSKLREAKRG